MESSPQVPEYLQIDPTNIHINETIVEQQRNGNLWRGTMDVAIKKVVYDPFKTLIIPRINKALEIFGILSKHQHPNVLPIYGVCDCTDTGFHIVMPNAAHNTLYSHLSDQTKEIPWAVRYRWINEAASAVAFLHSKGILHRDLKSPSFVVVNNSIKLSNFEFATTSSAERGEFDTVGTQRWLAPECNRILFPAHSFKSDIYALGMVMWEIVTRAIPFEDIDNLQLREDSRTEQRPEIPSGCPKAIATLITKCWDHNPDARPTAYEAVAVLQGLLVLEVQKEYITALRLFASLDNNTSDVIIDPKNVTLLEKIGAGTFGEVWKANWGKEQVAVKKLSLQNAKQELVQQLMTELCTLIRTRHPRLLQYYGVCFVSDIEIWLVMEFADGGNLNAAITNPDAKKSITWQHKWCMARDVTSAMEFLHKRNIPLYPKSVNILLVKGELKISDYGLPSATYFQSLHDDGVFKYPMLSLGRVMWEMAEQQDPISDNKVTSEHPPISSSCPESFRKLIQMCWNGDNADLPHIVQAIQKEIPAEPAKRRIKEHFEMYYKDSISKNQIKILERPPRPHHNPNVPAPPVPDKIEITILYPSIPDPKHIIGVRSEFIYYDRVAAHFKRFYVPSDPNLEVHVDRAEIISNPYLEQKYAEMNKLFKLRYKGLTELRPSDQSAQQQAYLEFLLTSKNLNPECMANPIYAWYCAPIDAIESICWYGLTPEEGNYGKGIYLAHMPKYGERYLQRVSEKKEGTYMFVLCWALLGKPLAVTQVSRTTTHHPDYSSHYAVVSNKAADKKLFRRKEDYQMRQGTTDYFPIAENETAMGDEIVLFEADQVLPRFIVHFSLLDKHQAQLRRERAAQEWKEQLLRRNEAHRFVWQATQLQHDAAKRPDSQYISENQPQAKPPSNVSDTVNSSRTPNITRRKRVEVFQVNYPELISLVGRAQVRTLIKPPPYPIENTNLPEVEEEIKIITLLPPSIHQTEEQKLAAVRYNERMYRRVAQYFHQFYVSTDLEYEARIDKIDVICNRHRDQKFLELYDEFTTKFQPLRNLQPTAQDDLQQAYLKHLCESHNLEPNSNANLISAWHAAPTEALDCIYWNGLLNLHTFDPGYFGKGISLTQMPNYGEYYLAKTKDKTEGSYSLILCWALLGNPLAVTKVSLGLEQTKDYTSHYAVVTRKPADNSFINDQDYPKLKEETTYFPATQEELLTKRLGDEIVLFAPDQVLPRYIVRFTVTKKPIHVDDIPKDPALSPSISSLASQRTLTEQKFEQQEQLEQREQLEPREQQKQRGQQDQQDQQDQREREQELQQAQNSTTNTRTDMDDSTFVSS